MLNGFVYLLQEYGVPVSMTYVMDFYKGLEDGLAETLDELFLFARLAFVKRVEHMDAYERAFAFYFYGVDIPKVAEGDPALFQTKQFREWLNKAIKKGDLPRHAMWELSHEELMKRFWDTVREQMEAHHGGSRWVGTGGKSPFGHSGAAVKGVRVYGESGNRSAVKVMGERKYVDYAATNTLSAQNIHQALQSLKNIVPAGAETDLQIDETIRQTARNGGEIELVFTRELRDKIKVRLLLDNGGSSMYPFIRLTELLFSKMQDRFQELKPYYFHNTVYGDIYTDPQRCVPFATSKLLQENPDTRIIIVGDASMAPEELYSSHGSIYFGATDDAEASGVWLQRIQERFKYCVWLNPIPADEWENSYGAWTINKIRSIFHMEDMTINGIKNAVEYLNNR
ncbi:MAG: hypothetical protein COB67_13285 [SAR324 cluster bacterium]|uniref:VWA containing CoxE family protein n=1 Tax=SAR324 cluster bacterium TaxID=2024889 RepID=A0A2A4SNL7_9DELT|nr:MAG: hypothetical protein COB67_13285 [SAR324 cluster bacterium]